MLWDDVALTVRPVNPTLSGTVLHKSLSPRELVKALSAGYGTDEALFTGGRALQAQGVYEKALTEFVTDFQKGAFTSYEDAQKHLVDKNIKNCDISYIIEELHRQMAEML